MAEMNNVTMDATSTATKNKPNWVTLIVAWALAVAFAVIGIVSLVKGNTKELTLNSVATFEDVTNHDGDENVYRFTFTPSSSDTYYFYVQNATLMSITYGDGYTKSLNNVGYERNYHVFKISLTADKKYTFSVTPNYYSTRDINAKITKASLDDDDDSSSSSSYRGW